MNKEVTFRDLLVKIKNIFSTDIYLINNQYIIAGEKSSEDNLGYSLCVLSPDMIDICNNSFDPYKIYYIKNITNAKDDLENNISEVSSLAERESVNYSLEEVINIKNKIETWDSFNFTEKQLDELFEDNMTINLFKDTDIPSVTISKSLFPLVTKKNVSDLYYSVIQDLQYINLMISFDFPLFQLYILYRYLDIDKEKGE